MPAATLHSRFMSIVEATGDRVVPFGFGRWGQVMRLMREDNVALISFQKSKYADEEEIEFTINLGIVCGKLRRPNDPPLAAAREGWTHLSERIGYLTDDPDDHWWTLDWGTDVRGLAAELSELVVTRGVPYLMRYITTEALVEYWRSDESSETTSRFDRDRYLRRLLS